MSLMEHVTTLFSGDSFGQDALITDENRNATCIVISETLIAAVLTKLDFQRVLRASESQKVDAKIAKI
jgi:CRP-like cAMP-binding protein